MFISLTTKIIRIKLSSSPLHLCVKTETMKHEFTSDFIPHYLEVTPRVFFWYEEGKLCSLSQIHLKTASVVLQQTIW